MWGDIFGFFLILGVNIIDDILSVLFVQNVNRGNAMRSALVSVTKVSFYALSIIFIVKSAWYVVPTALGAFIGTYITVKEGALWICQQRFKDFFRQVGISRYVLRVLRVGLK